MSRWRMRRVAGTAYAGAGISAARALEVNARPDGGVELWLAAVANLIVDSFTDGLMSVALQPELVAMATQEYIAGLRDGGWSGSSEAVQLAIAACGTAKYSWFGPVVAGRAIRDDAGNKSYGQDTSAASALRRLTSLVTLITDWAQMAHG